ncbi:MAG: sugar ABC transporter permease [Clostridia bacterium]|nr:sugar ABC transporter permease [Clostridia bacterium]
MSLKVTEQDRRRVRGTTLVFCVIFIVCAILAAVFAIITPRTQDIKAIGANNENITGLVETHDGSTYIIQSANWISERDSFTGEEILTLNITQAIKDKLAAHGESVANNSFTQMRMSVFETDTNKYFIAYDVNGNLFKLERNDNGQISVTDDYLLIKVVNEAFVPKNIKGMEAIGNKLYVLLLENNFFYVEEYNLDNLAQGALKRKFVWDISPSPEEGYIKIEAVKSATGVLSFYAHDGRLFFVKKGGGIIMMSTDLIDTRYGDGSMDFFADAKAAFDSVDKGLYNKFYNEEYIDTVVSKLLETADKKQLSKGGQPISKDEIIAIGEAYKAQSISKKVTIANVSASDADNWFVLQDFIDVFKSSEISDSTRSRVNQDAVTNATAAADGATKVELEWCKEYDANVMSMLVKEECLDKDCYNSLIPGESTINGMIYSRDNRAMYYSNASDGYLYVVSREDLEAAEIYSKVSTVAKRIDAIHCGKGQTFSDFGNGLSYNRFANTLYLKFANERRLVIVDINNAKSDIKNMDYKVVSSYIGAFDMYGISGDKDNSVTHVLHQVTKVDKKGVDHNYLYLCSYEPERFENKNVITVLFVIFLILAVVTFFISLWLLLSLRTDKGIKKVVFIAKDTKKNKFVYLALTFFVAMLMLFCYYEAVGAIAMSFFDYTREKPAWIWNNFANYVKIFNDQYFLPSIINMLFFLVSDIVLSIVPPIIFAILLILIRNKTTSNWVRSLMFIPGIIPSIASMLIWRVGIYGDEGLLNQLIMACGGQPVNWLLNKDYARWSLIMMGFPFVGGYLIFYGGMMNIPNEYHEAGRLEGLGTVKRFLKIDIPLIMPQIKYIFVTTFIASVQNFARTHILKSTVVTTPVQTMYTMMTEQANYGMSSAYATLIFIFLFVAIVTNFKMQKQDAMGADL